MKYSVVWLLCLLSSFSGYSCTLRMGIETSFPPYIVQQGDSWRGLNVELLQLLVQDIGCELEFIHSPWLRSLKLIEQGELDVLSHLTYNTERSAQFAFIGPHQLESIYLVGSAEAFAGLTGAEVVQRLEAAQIANAQVNTMADVWAHPQLQARDRWRTYRVHGVEPLRHDLASAAP